ncbi:MAG: hypothetical protein HY840_06230 [Bacteroidetes bacterium]|nr:hypothetical protein [Bacteroidota bacterium]
MGNPSWDTDVLAPLVKTTFTINNIIPDSLLHKNPDNSLNIVYNTNLYSFSTLTVPDTTIDTVYFYPFQLIVDSCDLIIPLLTNEDHFNVRTVQLTTVTIHSGKMQLAVENKTRKILDIHYRIPSATLSGNPFDVIVSVPAKTGNNSGVLSTTFDLSGYRFDLTGKNGTKVNTLVTSISAKVNCSDFSKDTVFPFADNIKVSNSFIDMVPQYAKGYFGNTITNITDSTDFSLFRHIIGGTINLEDVNIGLNIENTIGADARMTIDDLSSVNSRTGSKVSLLNSVIGSPINITRSVDNNGIVSPSSYNVSLAPLNSNIKQFIENFPDKLSYKLQYEFNPLGNVSGNNDFIYYDKLLKTSLNMTIPLSLVANNLVMADTVGFTMNANTTNVNSGNLYLYFENGFPFNAQAQLYLMNSNSTIIDSLVSVPNTISASSLDINYVCIGKKETKLTIWVDENMLNKLRSAKKMYIKIKFNTANQPNYLKIYSFYEMKVKVVGDFNYSVRKNN